MSSIQERLTAALADRYRVERELGTGGMASVFLAQDLKHDRQVAIKVLKPELAERIGADRFLAEIKTTASLQHPHVLPLFDSGAADGLLFYVMPYVTGETLRRRLEHGPRFTLDEALRLVSDLADALAYAHRRGIVHRDVKPENILLLEGRPLIADFGIAHAAPDRGATRMTIPGLAVGTPGYMSPEQAGGAAEIDGRSDQYSLACVLAEILAGDTPPPSSVEAAMQRALSRDASRRFPTMTDFTAALRLGDRPGVELEESIVVLPFANMSADRDNDYFADGMSEEIITALAHVPGLRVVARTSAFAFKGKSDDLRAIGERLRVRHVLEGSVRKAGSRLRITVQLVSAADGFQLWSERYDRQMDDVFAIQDEIATTIAAKLRVTLDRRRDGRLIKPPTENLDAYEAYLKGTALLHRRGAGTLQAIECFRMAIDHDPTYAPALAGLAQALVLASFWGVAEPYRVAAEAVDAADRALQADPNLVNAHVAAALVAICVEFDRAKAARAWERALAVAPQDNEARIAWAVFHLAYILGDFDGATRELRQVLERDPLNHALHAQLANMLSFGGRPSEGLVEARRAVELDPESLFARWSLMTALLRGGAHDQAIETGNAAVRSFGRTAWVLMGLCQAYAAIGRAEEATALFEELSARSHTEYVQPAVLAVMAMAIERRDLAMQLWTRAMAERDALMSAMLLHLPQSAKLRAQPEHRDVLRSIGWDEPIAAPDA